MFIPSLRSSLTTKTNVAQLAYPLVILLKFKLLVLLYQKDPNSHRIVDAGIARVIIQLLFQLIRLSLLQLNISIVFTIYRNKK